MVVEASETAEALLHNLHVLVLTGVLTVSSFLFALFSVAIDVNFSLPTFQIVFDCSHFSASTFVM